MTGGLINLLDEYGGVHYISCVRYKIHILYDVWVMSLDSFCTYVVGIWAHALTNAPK
jgi:hypothetical protein